MIGERLLGLRKDEGLTQDELALILKINKHSISLYEREKSKSPDEIKVLNAKHFNVSLDYPIGLIDEPLPYNFSGGILRIQDNLPKQASKLLKLYMGTLSKYYSK